MKFCCCWATEEAWCTKRYWVKLCTGGTVEPYIKLEIPECFRSLASPPWTGKGGLSILLLRPQRGGFLLFRSTLSGCQCLHRLAILTESIGESAATANKHTVEWATCRRKFCCTSSSSHIRWQNLSKASGAPPHPLPSSYLWGWCSQ